MPLKLSSELLQRIRRHGEAAYPEEGAGFLLGKVGDPPVVLEIIARKNTGVLGARHNRYLITPEDYMRAETEADAIQMDVIGVFHSHPDHPDEPSDFDREWAQPHFSYVITSIRGGQAEGSRSWILAEDRSHFTEELLDTN